MLERISTKFGKQLYERAISRWLEEKRSFGFNEEDIVYAVEKFLDFKPSLRGDKSDISFWAKKSWDDFQQFIFELEQQEEKKLKRLETIKLFENDECVVAQPLTHEAASKYGKDTKWCACSSYTMKFWNTYKENNGFVVLFLSKTNPEHKWIFHGPITSIHYHITDKYDQNIDIDQLLECLSAKLKLTNKDIMFLSETSLFKQDTEIFIAARMANELQKYTNYFTNKIEYIIMHLLGLAFDCII
jgi:hypothetical protein